MTKNKLSQKAKILSIAGSDSGGGAGIQADIKTATSLKTYITTAITCVTAQNSLLVEDVEYLPSEIIKKQINCVLDDIKIDAIKSGMLGNSEIIKAVSQALKSRKEQIPLIIDPVMVATSGDRLIKEKAILDLKKYLIPKCYLITPNLLEAEILSGVKIIDFKSMSKAARIIADLGAKNVLIKGGHMESNSKKIHHLMLIDNQEELIFSNKRLPIDKIHGTGCTLSCAIACFIAQKMELKKAIKKANKFVYKAINKGDFIGKGSLILGHF